jgi:hypothetical protein
VAVGGKAEWVLAGGPVITSAGGVAAQAVAWADGRILAAGTARELEMLVGPGTRRVDVAGSTVLPAFMDTHVHLNDAVLTEAYMLDLCAPAPRNIEELGRRVAERVRQRPPGEWVLGKRLRYDLLEERRYPTGRELDRYVSDRPVFLLSTGNHVGVANAAALRLAEIDESTPDPPGGTIEREPGSRRPNGILHERGKLRLDMRRPHCVIPPFTHRQRVEALRAVDRLFLRYGVTTIHSIVVSREEIEALIEADKEGTLSVRVHLLVRTIESHITFDDLDDVRAALRGTSLRFGGTKISIDGSALHFGAALSQPYVDRQDAGVVRIEREELSREVQRSHEAGVRVCIHAIGDRALRMALDAWEQAAKRFPRPGIRHRLEHLGNLPVTGDDLARVARLGLVASAQPGFLYFTGDTLARIIPRGLGELFPLRDVLRAGIPLVFNSDAPLISASPLIGMAAAIGRKTETGQVIAAGQALTTKEALAAYTEGAAYSGFEEDEIGTLEPGRIADLVIVNGDPLKASASDLLAMKVLATFRGGKLVYRDETWEGERGRPKR